MSHNTKHAWKDWGEPPVGGDLAEWQDGRCAWCGTDSAYRMVRDHCHMTGLVRGFLCNWCNTTESKSNDPEWDSWRAGDHPAAAMRYAEVYVSPWGGGTPIAPQSALIYYDDYERAAWYELAPAAIAAGRIAWPTEPPWIDTAEARREADMKAMRESMSRWDFLAPKKEAAS